MKKNEKNVKKVCFLMLSMALAAGVMTGCNGSSSGNEASQAPEKSPVTSSETPADGAAGTQEPYVVTMLTQGEQQEDLPRIMEKVNEILVRDLNMKLNRLGSPYGS